MDYWLGAADPAPTLTVHTSAVNSCNSCGQPRPAASIASSGIFVTPSCRFAAGGGGDDDDQPRDDHAGTARGAWHLPVRLARADGPEQKVDVREDPRIDITPAERKQWTDAVHQAAALAREFGPVNDRIQKMGGTSDDVIDLKRQSRELVSRISSLYNALGRWTGAPTKDQLSRLAYCQQMAKQLASR